MFLYRKFEFASAILLVILSVLTILANGLLLGAVWKDPLKCFRSPTTYFVIGLAIADLLTATTTEPFFAAFYFMRHLYGPEQALTRHEWPLRLYNVGQLISTVTISSSFIIVLALTWSQYIAISFPHKYKLWVTRSRVIFVTVASVVYFICFTLLPHTGVDKITYLKVDLALHPTLTSLVLLVTLVLLYRSFTRQVKRADAIMENMRNPSGRRVSALERQFTIVTIYLAGILLSSALPHVAVQYIFLYYPVQRGSASDSYISIAIRIRDLLLFLKVALDAFIYAWRLQTYRRALRETFSFRRKKKAPGLIRGTTRSLATTRV